MKYFTLKPGQKVNKTQHYTRDYLIRWLHERSNDPKLIKFFYKDETRPRVRVVNSLDRLDLVLTEAARTPDPFTGDNLAFKFLVQMGEAWGDEEPSAWPDAIRAKYEKDPSPKNYPKTLRQAVTEMIQTLSGFEALTGYPNRPYCPRASDVPADIEVGNGSQGIPLAVTFDQKTGVYNMRQVFGVLLENLPGSGSQMDGGLKVLRDLFFELYYSTPPDKRCNGDSRCFKDKTKESNNLWVILRTVEMGLTRNIGRLMAGTDINDPTFKDFFDTLVDGVLSPDLSPVVKTLISKNKGGREVFWKVLEQIFQLIDAGDGIDLQGPYLEEWKKTPNYQRAALMAGWRRDLMRLKQMVFYTMSLPPEVNRNLPDGVPRDTIPKFMAMLRPLIEGNTEYFSQHADKIDSLLRSRAASLMSRAMYEDRTKPEGKRAFASLFRDLVSEPSRGNDAMSIFKAIDADSTAKDSFSEFTDRVDALKQRADYCSLDMSGISKDILNFMAGKDPTPLGKQTAAQLRAALASTLERGDIEEMLRLAARDPEKLFKVLETIAHYSDTRGDLWQFTQLARRALSEVH